ncbi:hypothetical protein NTHI1209_02111 [Haemophilus influenzae]|uniref:Uncharacterized protein n=1 Tax=Haemophilus influenzae TaxID=727 RepID=A0A158T012_HAEIF|nr:hypothetical protein NTHI1209_02111 [Haemophilus influenzae]
MLNCQLLVDSWILICLAYYKISNVRKRLQNCCGITIIPTAHLLFSRKR